MNRAMRLNLALRSTIDHRRYHDVFEAVRTILLSRAPDQPMIIPVLGPTRVGKSWLAADLVRSLGCVETRPGCLWPVADVGIAAVPPKPNDLALYRAMLTACGYGYSDRERTAAARRRLVNVIRESGVKMLVLDECNHCSETGANLSPRAATDHFKSLVDETGVALLLLGLPKFQKLIDGNEQFRDRAHATILFTGYDWNDDADREAFCAAFMGLLQIFAEHDVTLDIDDTDCLRRLYGLSGGRFGVVVNILREIAVVIGERNRVRLADLRAAVRRCLQKSLKAGLFLGDESPGDVDLIRAHVRILEEAGIDPTVRDIRDVEALAT